MVKFCLKLALPPRKLNWLDRLQVCSSSPWNWSSRSVILGTVMEAMKSHRSRSLRQFVQSRAPWISSPNRWLAWEVSSLLGWQMWQISVLKLGNFWFEIEKFLFWNFLNFLTSFFVVYVAGCVRFIHIHIQLNTFSIFFRCVVRQIEYFRDFHLKMENLC